MFFHFSACTNVSFNKLTQRFSANNAQHREMLAILAAITQVIKSRSGGDGGEETSTEYFAALLTTLESSESQETTSGLLTNSSFFRLPIEKKINDPSPGRKMLFCSYTLMILHFFKCSNVIVKSQLNRVELS